MRKEIEFWANRTFEDFLEEVEFDKSVKAKIQETYFWEQVKKKIVDGNSVTKIKGINERNDGSISFRMADIFHSVAIKNEKFLPILYLLEIVKLLLAQGKTSSDVISGVLGRCYRSFASFLRDYDSKSKFDLVTNEYNNEIEFTTFQDPEIDAKYHADIVLELRKNDRFGRFFIWLYQSTQRSFDNIRSRLTGARGKLPNGVHVLAPIKTDIYESLRKKKKEKIRVEKRITEFVEKAKLTNDNIKNEIVSELEKELNEINITIEKFETEARFCDLNFEWALYSKEYVKHIISICVEMFDKKIVPDESYTKLKKKLQYPDLAVSSFLTFNKRLNLDQFYWEIAYDIIKNGYVIMKKIAKILETTESEVISILNNIMEKYPDNCKFDDLKSKGKILRFSKMDSNKFVAIFKEEIQKFYEKYIYLNDKNN